MTAGVASVALAAHMAHALTIHENTRFSGKIITNIGAAYATTGVFVHVPEASGEMPVPFWQMTNVVAGSTNQVLIDAQSYANNIAVQGLYYYFYGSRASDVPGARMMIERASTGATHTATIASITNNQYLATYLTLPDEPRLTMLQKGAYQVHLHARRTAGAGTVQLKAEIYLYNTNGVYYYEFEESEISQPLITSFNSYDLTVAVPEDRLVDVTDRVAVRIKAVNVLGAVGVELQTEGDTLAHVGLQVSGGNFVRKSGDTMDGYLTLVADPTNALHAATKAYVDAATNAVSPAALGLGSIAYSNASEYVHVTQVGTIAASNAGDYVHVAYTNAWVLKSGDTMTGALTLSGDPTEPAHAATKAYVDALSNAAAGVYLRKSGDVGSWLNIGSNALGSMPVPPGLGAMNAGYAEQAWLITNLAEGGQNVGYAEQGGSMSVLQWAHGGGNRGYVGEQGQMIVDVAGGQNVGYVWRNGTMYANELGAINFGGAYRGGTMHAQGVGALNHGEADYGALMHAQGDGAMNAGQAWKNATMYAGNPGSRNSGRAHDGAYVLATDGAENVVYAYTGSYVFTQTPGAHTRGYLREFGYVLNTGIASLVLVHLSHETNYMAGTESIGMGAVWVTNNQALVMGDGMASRGDGVLVARQAWLAAWPTDPSNAATKAYVDSRTLAVEQAARTLASGECDTNRVDILFTTNYLISAVYVWQQAPVENQVIVYTNGVAADALDFNTSASAKPIALPVGRFDRLGIAVTGVSQVVQFAFEGTR